MNISVWQSAFFIFGAAVAVAALVLLIAAIVSVVNSHNYPSGIKALWVLAILAFPLLGPIAWFAFGRNSHM